MERIVLLGDLHAGSHTAPWPAEWPAYTVASRYLAACLEHFSANVEPCDVLFLNGDLVDGPQRKSGGMGLFSPRLRDQVEAAIKLLEPLVAKSKKVYRLTGTPYHDDDHDPLFALDKHFGIESVKQVYNMQLGEGGGILNIAHHPGGGSTLYTGTKSSREMMKATVAAVRRKIPQVRWIVRSHLHHWNLHHEEGMSYMGLPCWQLPTPWAVKGDYFGWQPAIGAAEMFRDDTEPGGWRFRPRLYDPPATEIEVLT